MELPSKRTLNLLGFAACVAMMAYALFSQHVLGLDPCPLCIFQRVGIVMLGLVFMVAALHDPGDKGSRAYAALVLVAGGGAAGVAGRHVWLQNLPPDKVPACGPGLDFMLESFPPLEMLSMVLSGSGECANQLWSFLGLSMPAWVLICALGLSVYGVAVNVLRR